jgi:hypothetical protein
MTWEQWQEMLATKTHPRRLMTLEEMANPAVFMASDKTSGMTGTTGNLTMGSLDDQRPSDRGFAKRTMMSALTGKTTVVVRLAVTWARIAGEFAETGTPVAAVAQGRPVLAEQAATSASIRSEVADTADATVASESAGPVRAGAPHPDPATTDSGHPLTAAALQRLP